MTDKREDADLPEWDTPGTPVNPAYTNLPAWQGIAEGHLSACEQENRELRAEIERLRTALKAIASASDWHPDDIQAFARAACQCR